MYRCYCTQLTTSCICYARQRRSPHLLRHVSVLFHAWPSHKRHVCSLVQEESSRGHNPWSSSSDDAVYFHFVEILWAHPLSTNSTSCTLPRSYISNETRFLPLESRVMNVNSFSVLGETLPSGHPLPDPKHSEISYHLRNGPNQKCCAAVFCGYPEDMHALRPQCILSHTNQSDNITSETAVRGRGVIGLEETSLGRRHRSHLLIGPPPSLAPPGSRLLPAIARKMVKLITLATLVWWLPTTSCADIGDVGEQTSVTTSASSYDERPLLEGGCYSDGCEPDLTLDRLDSEVEQSRWSCEATDTDPCYITYTFGEARVVSSLYVYFSNVTEDMPVIISTQDSSTDDEEEDFVAQLVETVSFSYADVVELYVELLPAPSATALRIEADLPGAWVNIRETYIYVALEDGETTASSSSGSSGSGSLIGGLIFALIFCCGGCYIYSKCCDDGGGASASAIASSSSAATTNLQVVNMPAPTYAVHVVA